MNSEERAAEHRQKSFAEYVRRQRKAAAIRIAKWFGGAALVVVIGCGLLYLAARIVRLAWGAS